MSVICRLGLSAQATSRKLTAESTTEVKAQQGFGTRQLEKPCGAVGVFPDFVVTPLCLEHETLLRSLQNYQQTFRPDVPRTSADAAFASPCEACWKSATSPANAAESTYLASVVELTSMTGHTQMATPAPRRLVTTQP